VGESDKEQTIETCIHEIAETLAVLESNPPRKIDGFALSHKSKMPWKVLLYREAHIWRMVELSKRAFESFTSDQLVCGIVLTRAVLEVSAALWFLCAKVEAVVDSKVVGDVDEYLMKLAMGNATGWPENSAPGAGAMPRPVLGPCRARLRSARCWNKPKRTLRVLAINMACLVNTHTRTGRAPSCSIPIPTSKRP
jgi:hypothetical protein